MSEGSIYLLWTSHEWCRDGCHDTLRGAFLSRDQAEAAVAGLDDSEPDATTRIHTVPVGRVFPYES